MANLSKERKPDNFESQNFQKLSFTNIWGLQLNFVEYESFLELNSTDILAPCEMSLDNSTDSGNFSVRVIFDSSDRIVTHMHGLAVSAENELPSAWNLSLEDSAYSYFISSSDWLYFTQCLTSFSSIIIFYIFMHGLWCYFI